MDDCMTDVIQNPDVEDIYGRERERFAWKCGRSWNV